MKTERRRLNKRWWAVARGAWLAQIMLTPFAVSHAAMDGQVLGELLAGRTAEIVTLHGTQYVYHGVDGRFVSERPSSGSVASGRWLIDDEGAYCRKPEKGGIECFVAAFAGSSLRLTPVSGGHDVTIRRFEPGDTRHLIGDAYDDDSDCNCRLTARRRQHGSQQ